MSVHSTHSAQPAGRIAAYTLGCKTNTYETRAVLADFVALGYEICDFSATADVYLINTCSVTGEAGRKSGQMIRQARARNPEAAVIAMGCHIELGADFDAADILIGNQGKNQVPDVLAAWQQQKGKHEGLDIRTMEDFASPQVRLNDLRQPQYEEFREPALITETRAEIKIQDGCDNFCTYCAIPLARGRVRSREEAQILAEARTLAARGIQEIVLTGIHICSYGKDRGQDSLALISLLRQLSAIDGMARIRLGSLEPDSISAAFAEELGKLPLVCPHYHLSLQSGSDRTLRRMNRHYDSTSFRIAVERLRKAQPDASFTTDVMVAFPGETEADHEASLAFCREIGFSRLHIFRYSQRPGTLAAKMPQQVPGQLAARRAADFRALADELWNEHCTVRQGSRAVMLLEQEDNGHWRGYDEAYEPLLLDAAEVPGAIEGDLLPVILGRQEAEAVRVHPAAAFRREPQQ